ncbi:MAG: hypothetical protein QOF14_2763 [Hyphomicrobiales bacterium]|jgi:hypothetical protein|nr:hypothetical protein [Hyphomicrobiales bacterium]
MRRHKWLLSSVTAALALFPLAAQAQVLKVVEVNAPAINCVFAPSCTITVSDTTGNLLLPTLTPGTAWLQSRTFTAQGGTPGVGTTGYEYRLSMTQTAVPAECVTGLTLNFGPSKQLPYKDNALADVYVVTTGGLGTIGIKSAERFGDVIVFDFKAPLCADGPPDIKRTTFFFGLAAAATPMHVNATVSVIGVPSIYAVDARVPTHPVAADPPGGL